VATREEQAVDKKELGDQFRFGPVWHMDLVGSDKFNVPNVVSAFHFLETPKTTTGGGSTIFCNMEIAYASLPLDTRKQLDSLECIYDNDYHLLAQNRYNDFERLGPFSDSEDKQIVKPLVHRDESTGRKRLFFTPTRFNRFVGWTREESWELMTHVFYNYIQTPQNTANIQWDDGDIAIFNNHRLIHTSTPWEKYKGQNRRFRLCFLNSKKMHQPTKLVSVKKE
jgi:taurine dioxygenase